MRELAIGSYHDPDGHRHELVVGESGDGGWNVLDLDVAADTADLVEAFTDEQDGRPQAEAVARDYLTTIDATEPGTGPAAGEAIPEEGGSDARSHRRPRPAPRRHRARDAALPRPAR